MTEVNKLSKFHTFMEKAFCSEWYILLCAAVSLYGIYTNNEILPVALLILFSGVCLMTSRDITPVLLAVLLIPMMAYPRYANYDYYFRAFYLFAFIIPAYIVHLSVFRPKIKKPTKLLFATAFVAIAVSLGGLNVTTKEEVKAVFYFIFGLGLGLFIMQLVVEASIPEGKRTLAKNFAKLMTGVGIVGVGMIIIYYYKNFETIEASFRRFLNGLYWGNDLSTTLLLTMPFSFYLAMKCKKILTPVFLLLGLAQGAALILSLSRGGILFGAIMLPICMLAAFFAGKNRRIIVILTYVAAAAAAVFMIIRFLLPVLQEILPSVKVEEGEARTRLYKLAWETFKEFPIFGRGLGFKPSSSGYRPQEKGMFWFHSTLFQVIASMGLVGGVAYALQMFLRLHVLTNVKNTFNIFVALAFFGYTGYCMINVGTFMPFPFVIAVVEMFVIVERHNNGTETARQQELALGRKLKMNRQSVNHR